MRSAGVLLFIGFVAAVALYCAQRPTMARGDVIGAQLSTAKALLKDMRCQDEIRIGMTGSAPFVCRALYKNGDRAEYKLQIDRAGKIHLLDQNDTVAPRIKKTTDPWGD